ncbi:hypothetical protein BVY04_03095 [bacterium M21]|nr:hypothetical protein BVY04_03095 [bacterium M21]
MESPVTIESKDPEELQAALNKATAQIAHLQDQLAWFRRQVFGRKSERLIDFPQDFPMIPGFDLPEPKEEAPSKPETEKPPKPKKKRQKGSCTVDIPDDLERVEELVDVPESERTMPDGTKLSKIGEDRSEKLAFRPGEYYVKVYIRPKYAHPTDSKVGVLQEPMPSAIVEGSKFDLSFLAHIIIQKFVFHMPLYRIVEKLLSRDIRVTRQVLSQLIKNCGQNILPLYNLMVERTLAQGVIYTDDSPVSLLQQEKCKEARIWVYIGGLPNAPPYHIYQFTTGRSYSHPKKFLENFEGTLHADAFGAYEQLHNDVEKNISWAACWAHARRDFEKALTGAEDDTALWVMRQMRYLFMFERVAWARSPQERLRIRQEYELPIVEKIFRRFTQELTSRTLLPKSNLAKAIGYMQSRPENFRLYLDDPNLRMDNNTSERAIRKLTIGRKNWMFIGSEAAGESMAALFSIVQTCRAMGIKPQEYLEDIFRRLQDHPASRLEELLPDQWLKARGDEPMPKQK